MKRGSEFQPGDVLIRRFEEAVHDVMAGIEFPQSKRTPKTALAGHSLGRAGVIQAGIYAESARTVITLATQSFGAGAVSNLSPDCSVLLIHGAEDTVLPSFSSQRVYGAAHEPKRLIILPGNGHTLDESAKEVERIVYEWVVLELNPL